MLEDRYFIGKHTIAFSDKYNIYRKCELYMTSVDTINWMNREVKFYALLDGIEHEVRFNVLRTRTGNTPFYTVEEMGV